MTTPNKHGNFKESEMHISNEAYRRYLLHDENAVFDENGEFSQANLAKALLAKMYEEDDGPARVQKIIEKVKRDMKGRIRQNHSGPGMARLSFKNQLTQTRQRTAASGSRWYW